MAARRLLLFLLALPVLPAACRRPEVASYQVPKEKDPELPVADAQTATAPGAGAGPMTGAAVPTAEGPALAWTAPVRWKVKQASAMRKGSYSVPGDDGGEADFSISAFPSDVGGELANVNRWRGQVQLPPLGEADLPGVVARQELNGLRMTVVDFASGQGAKPQRILGAIVPFNDGTWFFKLMGPDTLVAKEKQVFLDFLKTVHPAQP